MDTAETRDQPTSVAVSEPVLSLRDVSVLFSGKAAVRNLAFSLYADLKDSGIHAATVTICGTVAPGTPFDPAYVLPQNMWGCSNAQIFSEVSPEMHWKFAIQHDLRCVSIVRL